MKLSTMLKYPSAFVPMAMSLGAVLAIVVHIARFGTDPQPDEGAAAHIWQMLMALQLPVVGLFAVKWLPAAPRQALIVLVLQIGCIVGAMAPVYLLKW